jgi:hypothetical protein
MQISSKIHLKRARIWLSLFIFGLVISGLTAFPLETELKWLGTQVEGSHSAIADWIRTCRDAVTDSNFNYPFLSYGTDWLAFAHLVLAMAFIGPLIDPEKNIWVIHFGMLACIAVFPLALIAGPIRGIPIYWQLIDCSFGVIGLIPLFFVRYHTLRIPMIATV